MVYYFCNLQPRGINVLALIMIYAVISSVNIFPQIYWLVIFLLLICKYSEDEEEQKTEEGEGAGSGGEGGWRGGSVLKHLLCRNERWDFWIPKLT